MTVVLLCVLLGGTLEGFGEVDRDQPKVQTEAPRAVGQTSTKEAVGAGILHLVNRIAIASGRIAMRRSRQPDLRVFAARVISEHEAIERRLQTWLAHHRDAGHLLKDAAPEGSAAQLRIPDRLRKTRPQAFDRTFLRATMMMATRSQRFLAAVRADAAFEPELARLLEDATALLAREHAAAQALADELPPQAPQPRS
jgi:predicted outer membrane protein